jgi:hypothetical protein
MRWLVLSLFALVWLTAGCASAQSHGPIRPATPQPVPIAPPAKYEAVEKPPEGTRAVREQEVYPLG